jgi:antitoxin component of MazEF toxin-antitoxin module
MLFEKKILEIGGTLYIPLPQDLAKYLGLEQGSEVILQDKEEGKKKTVTVWKK